MVPELAVAMLAEQLKEHSEKSETDDYLADRQRDEAEALSVEFLNQVIEEMGARKAKGAEVQPPRPRLPEPPRVTVLQAWPRGPAPRGAGVLPPRPRWPRPPRATASWAQPWSPVPRGAEVLPPRPRPPGIQRASGQRAPPRSLGTEGAATLPPRPRPQQRRCRKKGYVRPQPWLLRSAPRPRL